MGVLFPFSFCIASWLAGKCTPLYPGTGVLIVQLLLQQAGTRLGPFFYCLLFYYYEIAYSSMLLWSMEHGAYMD